MYLVRDPRACTLSAIHFCRSKRRKLFEPSIDQLVDSEWDPALQLYTGWHSHVAEWARFSHHALNVAVVSYEELVVAPHKVPPPRRTHAAPRPPPARHPL